jgi:glycosyltransferase involved in cell wall biosynthesis
LRILYVSSGEKSGGANIAAYRLYSAISKKASIEAKFISIDSLSYKFLNKLIHKLNYRISKTLVSSDKFFSWSFFSVIGLQKAIKKYNPDVLHLHWTSLGILKLVDPTIVNAKIIVTLHDMRALTNGCHYSEKCQLYMSSCSSCEFNVLDARLQQFLPSYLQCSNKITYIAPSHWMFDCANKAEITKLNESMVVCIPNVSPDFIERDKRLKNRDFKVIASGALNYDMDNRKGFDLLLKFMSSYTGPFFQLVLYGLSDPSEVKKSFPKNERIDVRFHGLLSPASMEKLNNESHGLLFLSKHENLSNVLVDNLRHGNFAVGFDIGGNQDIILHGKTGYLAKPFEINELCEGVEFCIQKDAELFYRNCKTLYSNNFSVSKVVEQHISVYESE